MDIEFGTDGWRTTVEEFTTPRVRAVGQAVADHVREEASGEGRPAVAVVNSSTVVRQPSVPNSTSMPAGRRRPVKRAVPRRGGCCRPLGWDW